MNSITIQLKLYKYTLYSKCKRGEGICFNEKDEDNGWQYSRRAHLVRIY